MPTLAFVPLLLLAAFACPVSMWIMGRMAGRKPACCEPLGDRRQDSATTETLLEELEKEVARLRDVVEKQHELPAGAQRDR